MFVQMYSCMSLFNNIKAILYRLLHKLLHGFSISLKFISLICFVITSDSDGNLFFSHSSWKRSILYDILHICDLSQVNTTFISSNFEKGFHYNCRMTPSIYFDFSLKISFCYSSPLKSFL